MKLIIRKKIQETADTFSLVLEPAETENLDYLPGQYLPVIYSGITGREERRAYSFSSCPGVDPLPVITIRRVTNGAVSTWLTKHAAPGDVIRAAQPAGRFLLPAQLPETLVYLAAGSGITPIISHLKALFETEMPANKRVVLFYAARTPADTIFKSKIDDYLARFSDRFFCNYVFSREKNYPNSLFGHLNNTWFSSLIAALWPNGPSALDQKTTRFYLCAPKALMRMAQMTLRVMDFLPENIIQENFVPDMRLPSRVINPAKSHTVSVFKNGASQKFEVYQGETILNAALRQGIDLPYTCKSGICLSCLAQCTKGFADVAFVEQTLHKGPGDWINTCIAYPTTDQIELYYD